LFSADLAAFSVETLVVLALSQASLDAFSSASRADMRARAVVKATVIQKKGGRKKTSAITGSYKNKCIKVKEGTTSTRNIP
jgi:hypothetical protein